MSYEGYADKEKRKEYLKKYMQDVRERQKERTERGITASEKLVDAQLEAKIEEMTFRNFGDMQYSWCVEDRIHAGESKEDAEKYCTECRKEVRRIIATDIQEQMERVKEVPSVIKESMKKPMPEVDADLLASCVKVRMDGLGEDREAAEAYCTDVLQDPALAVFMEWQPKREAARLQTAEIREQLINNKYLLRLREIHKTRMPTSQEYIDCKADAEREYERENPSRPDAGVDQEFAERTYIIQKLLGVSQKHAESHVMREMTLEGRLADVTERTYNRESVGDLYNKPREQVIAENFPEQSHYGKDTKAREEFQKFEDEQKNKGVSMPSDSYRSPRPGRMTVGDLHGKTRKEILDMSKDEDQK